MVVTLRSVALAALLGCWADSLSAQNLPPPEDSRQGMLREAMLGMLPSQPGVPTTRALRRCIELPVAPPNDRLQGPHGDTLISTRCEVIGYEVVNSAPSGRWSAARYSWTSLFTAEDLARGPTARDTVTEQEVVLFE